MTMLLAWGSRVSLAFRMEAVSIAQGLGFDPSWLMACMWFESKLRPDAKNPKSSATGLIGFMRKTALNLGTTVEELAAMPAEEQLRFVNKYFLPFAGRIKTLSDCYMAILYPDAIGQPEDFVLFSGGDAYELNKGLDFDKDHAVTKAEAAAFVVRALEEGLLPTNATYISDATPITEQPTTPPITEQPTTPPITSPAQVPDMPAILASIIPMILQLFAPRVEKQLQKITGSSAEVVQPFMQDLINKAGELVGVVKPGEVVTTDTQAVQIYAKLAEAKTDNPPVVQILEAHALDYLDKLTPLFDRLAQADAEVNRASIEGKNAAMLRQQSKPDEIVRVVVNNVNGVSWMVLGGVMVAIIAAVVCKAVWPESPEYVTVLIALGGPLLGQVMKERGAVVAYYFDGTPSSNAANTINQQIATATRVDK